MTPKTDFVRIILIALAWLSFVGLCIDAGGFLTNFIATLFFKADLAKNFWGKLNLWPLYELGQGRFVMLMSTMVIASVMKALLFYNIIMVIHEKKVSLSKPFSETAKKFIQIMGFISLAIGLFSGWCAKMVEKLVSEGVEMPSIQALKVDGSDVWLFMGIILLIIAQVFKKGIDLQNENDLTV